MHYLPKSSLIQSLDKKNTQFFFHFELSLFLSLCCRPLLILFWGLVVKSFVHSRKMASKVWVYRVLKTLLILLCIILFFVLMAKIGKKFKDSQWKAMATLQEEYSELALPELTICPSTPFKSSAVNVLDFDSNIYELAEFVTEIGSLATVKSEEIRFV